MPELIINGPAGRLEARYHHEGASDSPIALILHPHPTFGGTMNNQVVYALYHTFVARGFSVLRFNFRGVGRSQGFWDGGPGELADAASALDWLQIIKPDARTCWIAGVSFGTWIAMQLLMRRPEIEGFICVAPPSNLYDFSFLAPCPSSGLMINGDNDRVVPSASVGELTQKLKTQKGIKIDHEVVPGANHFFENKVDELTAIVGSYVDMRLAMPPRETKRDRLLERLAPPAAAKEAPKDDATGEEE
ncbi:MAG: alpha/beta hydrolase [Pseudomonadota bacterium]